MANTNEMLYHRSMQLSILLFLQSIHSHFLDRAMNFISLLGEVFVPLIVLSALYWCVSRKKAFTILSSLMTALLATQIVKAIVRSPRPFQAHPELIEGDRIETATGYSFPSGHSTTSSSFYSSLSCVCRKKWLTAICTILIILVPVSRMYLGVHWPIDVLVGTAIGLASGLLLSGIFARIYDDKEKCIRFTLASGLAALILSAILAVLLELDVIDRVAFADLASNAAVASGAMLGVFLDRKSLQYDESAGTAFRKAVRFILGFAAVLAIGAIAMLLPLPHYASSCVLFFAAGFTVTFLFPWIAVKANLFR